MGHSYSSILFATPSFAEGAARLLGFGDTLTEYNRSPTSEEADAKALAADWNAVIDDLARAFKKVGEDIGVARQLEFAW
jgi:hypothetical protein